MSEGIKRVILHSVRPDYQLTAESARLSVNLPSVQSWSLTVCRRPKEINKAEAADCVKATHHQSEKTPITQSAHKTTTQSQPHE